MKTTIIVAMNEEGGIGIDNQLPWNIPEDLKHFKRRTMGKPVLMGRKTFESIGRPLPGRTNIVLTRDPAKFLKDHPGLDNVIVSSVLEEAYAHARMVPECDELMIIGGAEIYEKALEKLAVTGICMSLVKGEKGNVPTDVKFPISPNELKKRLNVDASRCHEYEDFDVYEFDVLSPRGT